MQDFEQILLSQMKDIASLHEVSAFPIAYGYYIIFLFFVLIGLVVFFKDLKRKKYLKSWKYKTLKEIKVLEDNIDKAPIKLIIARLNELVKRVAMKTYSREEVASLSGKSFLKWLTNNDPNSFNWEKKASFIIDAPYKSEQSIEVKISSIKNAINALKGWLK